MSLKLNSATGTYVSRTANLPYDVYTLCGWVRGVDITSGAPIVLWTRKGASGGYVLLTQDTSEQIQLETGAGAQTETNNPAPAAGAWYFVALVMNGTFGNAVYYWAEGDSSPTTILTGMLVGDSADSGQVYLGDSLYNSSPLCSFRYWRCWNTALDTTALSSEKSFQPTGTGSSAANTTSGLVFSWPLANSTDTTDWGPNGYSPTLNGTMTTDASEPSFGASAVDLSGAATVGASVSGVLGVKMLKLLTSSAAIGATVDGVVFAAQGGAIVGAEIGEFTGKTIVAGSGADAGKGVLLIPVTDFGGTALNEGDAPLVYLKNSTHFTPIWPGLIVPT